MELNELVARVSLCGSVRFVFQLGFSPLDYENQVFSIRHTHVITMRVSREEFSVEIDEFWN